VGTIERGDGGLEVTLAALRFADAEIKARLIFGAVVDRPLKFGDGLVVLPGSNVDVS